MKPIIVLNLKTYSESTGKEAVKLCEIARDVSKETGVRIICCSQALDLRECAKTGCEIFSQGAEAFEFGAHTGATLPASLKDAGARGIMLNHAERKMKKEEIEKAVKIARKLKLETLICSANKQETEMAARIAPDYIAVEPPELIGTGISVSTAKPEVVSGAVKQVKAIADIPVLCGAGISNAQDVKKAIQLGTVGVLLASAYVKSKEPKKLLEEMAKACL
jgi:triosephosphate isomerase